jgi:hypothetical protein
MFTFISFVAAGVTIAYGTHLAFNAGQPRLNPWRPLYPQDIEANTPAFEEDEGVDFTEDHQNDLHELYEERLTELR